MTRFLSFDDVIFIAERELGSPVPIRDAGLLASAVARPSSTVFGQDAYPTIWTKAAALLQSVVVNHALLDGNKRLGWLTSVTLVALNRPVAIPDIDLEAAYALVIDVATDTNLEIDVIAERLEQLLDSSG